MTAQRPFLNMAPTLIKRPVRELHHMERDSDPYRTGPRHVTDTAFRRQHIECRPTRYVAPCLESNLKPRKCSDGVSAITEVVKSPMGTSRICVDQNRRPNRPTGANKVSSNPIAVISPMRFRVISQLLTDHHDGVHHRTPPEPQSGRRAPLTSELP
jgi:hypothetical protein